MNRVALTTLVLIAPACVALSSGEPLGSTQEPAVGGFNGRWPSPEIPVCWVTMSDDAGVIDAGAFRTEQMTVRTTVNTAFEPAGVEFTGWGPCAGSGTDRIEITVSDVPPETDPGRQSPTPMHLNFVMKNGGPTAARGHCADSARVDNCIKMAAVHEFGHALGLNHEEARTDMLVNCGVIGPRLYDDFEVDLGPFDLSSVDNHCNPQLYGLPSYPDQWVLSPGDVAAIQLLFGKASATNPITISIGSSLFPWYFLHTNASGIAEVVPIDGPLGTDALFTVVPALNGDPTMVSLQSSGDGTQFLCNDNPFNPVHLAAGCDPALSSWTIDTTTDIAPGDSGLRFVLPSGRTMNIGPSPANQVFTALPPDVPNPQEMSFIPRTQVPERLLETALDQGAKPPKQLTTGTYLAHVDGGLLMEQLPAGQRSLGNWELVAGLDNPQLVSIRVTDPQLGQLFIMEQSGNPTLVAAADVIPARATFTRIRTAAPTVFLSSYRFVEELGGNLELCVSNGALAMCPSTDVTADANFFQVLPIPSPIPGANSNDVDFCAKAVSACLLGDEPSYTSLSATCQALGGLQPPCFFEPIGDRGDPINSASDPVSSLFPRSTVSLETPGTLGCTGVILTPNSILTAAHCNVGPTTIVHFYPLAAADGDLPVTAEDIPASPGPVATQNNLTCSQTDPTFPNSCFTQSNGGVRHNADLAVLTLSTGVRTDLGYSPVVLAPKGFGGQGLTDAGLPSWWEVASGGATPIDGQSPQVWAPVSYVASSDPNQPQGFFSVLGTYGTTGDTGGPIFQASISSDPLAALGDAGGEADGGFVLPMALVGLVSAIGPCQGTDSCTFANTVVSVTQPDNYEWLVGLGGADVSAVASFGAGN